jgi:hypothetical protein
MINNDIQDNYHSTTHPFFIDQVEVRAKKKSIHFADEVLHLVTETLPTLPSHYINRIKGYTNEHVSYFQMHVLGCMFGVGARCPHPATDNDDATYVGRREVPDGTHLNVMTHLPTELEYGVAMNLFGRHGLGGFSFLYEGGAQMLTMRVRYHSPFIETTQEDGLLPHHSLANFPIPLMGYMVMLYGVPLEVLDYGGAAYVIISINNNHHDTQSLPLSSVLCVMNQCPTARMNARNQKELVELKTKPNIYLLL